MLTSCKTQIANIHAPMKAKPQDMFCIICLLDGMKVEGF